MSIASELADLASNKAAIKAAIEAKGPSVAPTDALSQWPTAIASIQTADDLADKVTRFFDVDGNVLYAYTKKQTAALTALPEPPARTGLKCLGWNYTLSEIKTRVGTDPEGYIAVGCLYGTTDDKNQLKIRISSSENATVEFKFAKPYNGSSTTITIEWGDGQSQSVTCSSTTVMSASHTYSPVAYPANYTISMKGTNPFCLGPSSYTYVSKGSSPNWGVYTTNLSPVLVEFHASETKSAMINAYLLSGCSQLTEATFSTSSAGANSAYLGGGGELYITETKLRSLATPSGFSNYGAFCAFCDELLYVSSRGSSNNTAKTSIAYDCPELVMYTADRNSSLTMTFTKGFYRDHSLEYAPPFSAPTDTSASSTANYASSLKRAVVGLYTGGSKTGTGTYAFQYCANLAAVVLPFGLTTINNYAFNYCYSLKSIEVPSSVTSIGNYALSYTGLEEIKLPSSVTSIGSYAFRNSPRLRVLEIPGLSGAFTNTYVTGCWGLEKLVLGAGCTAINGLIQSAALAVIDFRSATAVPTTNTTFIGGVSNSEYYPYVKIVVPDSLYSSWTTATNWADVADHIVRASDYTEG